MLAAAHSSPGAVPTIAVDDASERSPRQVLHELRNNSLPFVHADNLTQSRQVPPGVRTLGVPAATKREIQVATVVFRL